MSDFFNLFLDGTEGMPRPKAVNVEQSQGRVRVQITMPKPSEVRYVAGRLGLVAETSTKTASSGWTYRTTGVRVERPGLTVYVGACEMAAPGESLPEAAEAVAS